MKNQFRSIASTMLLGAALTMGSIFATTANADHHGKLKAAIDHPDRPDAEKARDANRKPFDVLLFAGVRPGDTVLDLNSGSGYYSEILSHFVGDQGKVYAHNGSVYWAFMQKTVPARFTERLSNVVPLNVESEAVDLDAGSVDVAMSVLAYHDYFMEHEARKGPEDMAAILASIYAALKPGGAYVVIDHEGPAGSDGELAGKLHRINSEFVKRQVLAAGFTLDAESDLLVNSEDDNGQSPFRPEFRGKTNRFIMKFVK